MLHTARDPVVDPSNAVESIARREASGLDRAEPEIIDHEPLFHFEEVRPFGQARAKPGNQGRSTGSSLGEQLTRREVSILKRLESGLRKSPRPSSSRRARSSGTFTMSIAR
jgi:hypothetical protein